MVKRIEIAGFGGPEQMSLAERPDPKPGADEILIRHHAIGVNYIDTYHRSGLYPIPLPSGIGLEAAGVVEAVGAEVTDLKEGDRVGYCSGPIGAYAERHVIKANRAIRLPERISYEDAAASMLKGLTVQYLIRQIYPVAAGETVLFHAAAGGVGLIACQWLAALGATVIGTVGSESKAEAAKAAGCAHVIRYDIEDVPARVLEITGGEKLPVVFDGVGKTTWPMSLDSLRRRGLLVSFGNASGPVENVNLGVLAAKGSLFVTRPTLFDYTATAEALNSAADDFFGAVLAGSVKLNIHATYPLAEAATAHRDLEARKTSGSLLLKP